ncbi:MAG: sulfate adenylyltransferase subunit CysN [Akkermansiaceae bacterium]|jgi:bifunctional enzyme CysN/CysC|nr:sulfate adenylyltransferase subunit CysN [Akkermansiaceae bacterium]
MTPETPSDTDLRACLDRHERKDLLRLLTCGSVDDGKSTLIGRLLHDSGTLHEDQLAAVTRDSREHGTTGGGFDPALLTDGLKAEREQGITIDVAYRYFSTERRKFIIADTPGHEQYTRNMATGASGCQLAVILIDARHGVLTQTRRHCFIVSLLGIRHVVVAVNKMDLTDWSAGVFDAIRSEFAEFAARLDFTDLHFIPMAALHGDNVVGRSPNMPWFEGPPLLHHLETVHISSDRNLVDLRLPVQSVIRPGPGFRGFAGSLASGVLRTGDEVVVATSGHRSRVRSILWAGAEVREAVAPMPVVVTLEDEIDASRGDLLAPPNNLPKVASEIEAMLVWMDAAPARMGGTYLVKHTTQSLPATLSALRYKTDVNTLRKTAADTLHMNEIGRAHLSLHRPLAFDPYRNNPATGAFILIDRLTHATAAAGVIIDRTVARRDPYLTQPASDHIAREHGQVSRTDRERLTGQRGATIWLTGLSGSGKSAISQALERVLTGWGRLTLVLDGDNLRHGLTRDLGFSAADRAENIRRVAEVARLLNDAGVLVITALISPYRKDRETAREIIGAECFHDVFVDTPLEVCEQRDTKGLYQKARAGLIPRFTGISDPYEAPAAPFLRVRGDQGSPDDQAAIIIARLRDEDLLPPDPLLA